MRNTYYIFLLLSLGFFSACNSNTGTEGTQSGKANVDGQTLLKPFSDSVKLDTFRIALKGESLKDMVMSFNITAHDGAKIYQKDFKVTDLIKNYESTLDLKKESKQKEFIQQELKLFFEDENFLEPAVTENENPDANTPDKAFFAELKRSALNGFKYRTSNEQKVYIAWSEKEHKVLPYYSCCK